MFNAPLLYRVGDFPNWKKVVQQVVEKDRTVLQNWKVCVPTVSDLVNVSLTASSTTTCWLFCRIEGFLDPLPPLPLSLFLGAKLWSH